MKQAAMYVRVSTHHQKEEATIESQKEVLHQFAKSLEFEINPDWVFEDNGISGSTLARPALDKLRDYVSEGIIECIFVLSPDRLSRKYAYQAILLDEFRANDVTVIFQNSPQPQTPTEHLLLQMQGVFAEYERAQIAERSRRGKLHRAKNGHVSVFSHAPYGYRYISSKTKELPAYFEVIDREANVVKLVFNLYVKERVSISKICEHLSNQGISTHKGFKKWSRSVIAGMLKNSAYQGLAYFARREKKTPDPMRLASRTSRMKGRYTAKGSHTLRDSKDWIGIPVPKIIETEVFEIAQQLLQKNKHLSIRNGKPGALLQGLVSCKECGYGLNRSISGEKKGGYNYYRCSGRARNRNTCINPGIREDALDKAIWDSVISMLEEPELVKMEIERRISDFEDTPAHQQQRAIKNKLEKLKTESTRLLDAYQSECIELSELKTRMNVIQQESNRLKREIEQSSSGMTKKQLIELNDAMAYFSEHLRNESHSLEFEEKRKILRMLIRNVQIGKDGIQVEHIIPLKKKAISQQIARLCPQRLCASALNSSLP